jgi:MFS family permease
MQHVLGYSSIATGVAFLPVSLGIGVLSLGFSARLNFRFGPKAVLQAGLVMLAAGLAWMVRAPVGASYAVDLLPSMLLLGVGAGLSFPALMTLAMSGATPGESGLASGLVNTTVQVGGALGLAVLATLSTTRTAHLVATGEGHASALTGGYHLAWIISAGIALASLAIATPLLRSVRLGEDPARAGQEAEVNSLDLDPSYAEAA